MNEQCYVTVQIGETIVKGPIDKDKALALAIYITREIRTQANPTQTNGDMNPVSHSQQAENDANGISPRQLMNLRKNPKWEQQQICERYQVSSLAELTKAQATEAITASMERKEREKAQMH